MPRLQVVSPDAAVGDVKEVYDTIEQRFGRVPNLIQALGNSPVALKAYVTLDALIAEGTLVPVEREIVRLIVSEYNQCHYCVAAHTLGCRAASLSDREILELRRGNAGNPRHAALAAFTRRVMETKGFVADEDLRRFRDAGYEDQHVGEIITVIGQKTISNYFNHVHETELDFPAAPEL
ncbi:MAG: carboxymuconolactone decarboxylase family protein [Acidobacteriota bacterium]